MTRRGFVLIMVIGILGVLALVAISLAGRSKTTSFTSKNFHSATLSRLAARSGLEKAVLATRLYGLRNAPSFETQLTAAGDDRNRNGVEDPGEDVAGDGWAISGSLENQATPSLALAEDPGAVNPVSLQLVTEGQSHGVSWLDDRLRPTQAAVIRLRSHSALDINGGVTSGEGPAGTQYESLSAQTYAANDIRHPFNRRTVELFNAWGNYQKYLRMVDPERSFNFSVDLNHPDNLLSTSSSGGDWYRCPVGSFDRFDASGTHFNDNMNGLFDIAMEPALGTRLVQARPAGGYRDFETIKQVVRDYVLSWRDRLGTWSMVGLSMMGVPDTPLPPITEQDVADVQDELMALINLQPTRRTEILVVTLDAPAPGPLDPGPGESSFFERIENLQSLRSPCFEFEATPVDVNMADLSVLASMIYSVRQVKVRQVAPMSLGSNPIDDVTWTFPSISGNPQMAENAFQAQFNYGTMPAILPEEPLHSMTESIQMARDLIARRTTARFTGFRDLRAFLLSWDNGHDAKQLGATEGQEFLTTYPGSSLYYVGNYEDRGSQNVRQQILLHLLNPNLNLNCLVLDEALPRSFDNSIVGIGADGYDCYASRPFYRRFFFDKFDPHLLGATLSFESPDFSAECLGYHIGPTGKRLGQSSLTASFSAFEILTLTSQKDFDAAATNLGNEWVSYPEMPGVAPSHRDGHLALKPTIPDASSLGGTNVLSVSLNGYEPDPTQTTPQGHWPRGSRVLQGPNELPARGQFLNSLNPEPGSPVPSLFPATLSDVDAVSDLLPGGGIRVSSYNNSLDLSRGVAGPPDVWKNRREAMLVLRNAKTSDTVDANLPDSSLFLPGLPKALPSYHEGLISFFVKPSSYPIYSSSGYKNNRGMQTLFYTNFIVFDQETRSRALSLGLSASEANIQATYVAHLKLSWGALMNEEGFRFNAVPPTWPLVQPYDTPSSFFGQSASGPHYFSGMTGHTVDGQTGYLFGTNSLDPAGARIFGDPYTYAGLPTQEGHWSVENPYAEERLQLEFVMVKYADFDPDHMGSFNSINNQGLDPTYDTWDASDVMSPLGRSCQYVMPVSRPLNLYDTSDPSCPGHHAVRKTFVIGHPFNLQPGADRGKGPLDSRGNHQGLVGFGRWNHIVIGWKSLFNLLDNAPGGAHGGALAVYVNGAFRKAVDDFEIAGLLTQQDYFEGYPSATLTDDPWMSGGAGPHGAYSGNPTLKHKTNMVPWPVSPVLDPEEGDYFPMSAPYHNMFSVSPSLSDHTYSRGRGLNNDVRKTALLTRFPSRFYFGFEPHHFENYSVANNPVTTLMPYFGQNFFQGSMMGIDIFNAPAGALSTPDGGFVGELPGYSDFSVYPTDTSASPLILKPLLLSQNSSSVVAVRMNAHLPDYHQFWDDHEATPPGPDPQDMQELTTDVWVNGQNEGVLTLSQSSVLTTSELWFAPAPLSPADPGALEIRLSFRGPQRVMSTPVVENIDVIQMPPVNFTRFNWE